MKNSLSIAGKNIFVRFGSKLRIQIPERFNLLYIFRLYYLLPLGFPK
jgi:hypothetical protein